MKNRKGKGIVILGVCLAGLLILPWTALAEGFSQPTAEYSADRHIIAEGGSFEGKVHSAPGKERMEMQAGEATTIVRMDKKVMWTLLPAQKQYMEFQFSEQGEKNRAQGDYRDCDVRQTDAGKETVEGFETRKMAMEITCPGNEKRSGTVWLTKENIPIRMESSRSGSKKDTVRVELKNLKIGKQDPKLFEIPAGYAKMEMPSFGNIRQMMKGQPSGQGEAAKEPGGKGAADTALDPAKKLKGILGW